MLALSGLASAGSIAAEPEPEAHATGIFLNMEGDVLTARHAVDGCKSLYAFKDGRIVPARIKAMSDEVDAAVLSTRLTPMLVATFPLAASGTDSTAPVFAEGYAALQAMPERHRAMFNAVTTPGPARFSMMSPVRPGASGSGVLAADGRMLAMVVERVSFASRSARSRPLTSRGYGIASSNGATQVAAVSAEDIKRFLRANSIGFAQSGHAQLGHGQAVAPRATTLSTGVVCER